MFLSPEDKEIGKVNFNAAIGAKSVRRDFLMKQITAGASSKNGLGSLYFGYENSVSEPVKVGILGTGDEGSVLIGALNPKFMTVKAIADIRPFNKWRAFRGDNDNEKIHKIRPGLMEIYGWKTEDEARRNVKVYDAWQDLIAKAKEDGIEAVIIALPLHLHAPAAIAAMQAGLHVITEKLMAQTVHECKEMARCAKQKNVYLAVGHQRHYNILYNNAVELIKKGVLGELHYIRAQWHRGNMPGKDSWQQAMPKKLKPSDPLSGKLVNSQEGCAKEIEKLKEELAKEKNEKKKKQLEKTIKTLEVRLEQINAQIADQDVDAAKYGYEAKQYKNAKGEVLYDRPAAEELIRWRLWDRTGGGMMAELGSHQLDAAAIFIAAVHGGEKQMPLSVSAAGNRPLFGADREIEDHVYCIFEFPAPGYDPNDPINCRKKIGVQYASINGNVFGGYGETVFGTQGTLVLEREIDAMLYKTHETNSKTKVVVGDKGKSKLEIVEPGDENAAETTESAAVGQLGVLPAERGYAEELEHFAWCIRNPSPEHMPRCHPKVAMGDAVIALTSNMAARKGARIEFKKEWFDVDSDETPEGVKPDLSRYGSKPVEDSKPSEDPKPAEAAKPAEDPKPTEDSKPVEDTKPADDPKPADKE